MDNRDHVTWFESERFFFHDITIDENISASYKTMEKITSIFMIFGEIDIDSVASRSFIGNNVCFGHRAVEMKITCTDYTDFYTWFKGILSF